MKYIKPLKIITFCTCVGVATYYLSTVNAYICNTVNNYKRKIAADIIAKDLEGKPITVDIKSKKTVDPAKLTLEQAVKGLWVLQQQNEQLRYSLDTVRSALEYRPVEE